MERLVTNEAWEDTAVWKIYQLLYVGPLLGETGDPRPRLGMCTYPDTLLPMACRWEEKKLLLLSAWAEEGGRATRPVLDPSTHPMAGV